MTRKKKHVVYGAAIALGLMVLTVDRLILGGSTDPAAAAAGEDAGLVRLDVAGGPPGSGASAAASGVPVLLFPRNLPTFDASSDTLRDFFAPPGEHANDVGSANAKTEVTPAQQFAATHHLEGTIVGRTHQVAIINGRRLHKGEVLDQYVLTEIAAQEVVFQHGDETVVLRTARPLDKPQGAAPPPSADPPP